MRVLHIPQRKFCGKCGNVPVHILFRRAEEVLPEYFHRLPQYLIVLLAKFKDLSAFPQLLLLLLRLFNLRFYLEVEEIRLLVVKV